MIQPEPMPGRWTTLALVGAGGFMASLDTSIVNITLPAIAKQFGVPLSGVVEWVIIAYLLAVVSLLLTAGRLADMLGHKPIWLAGLVLFTAGSALCGAAPSLGTLILFRAFQGIGGALLMGISAALLTSGFPDAERGRALGFNAVVTGLGVTAGPTLGGLLAHLFTWRAVFYVNLPLGVASAVATAVILKRRPRAEVASFDTLGAVLLAVAIGALTLGLSFGQEWGWGSARLLAAIACGVAALAALIVVERKVREPIIDLSLFRNRLFAAASVSKLLSFLALFSVSFLMPFYLEELRGLPTVRAGLLLTPLPLAMMLVAPISGSMADRIGTRLLSSVGLGVASVALVLISLLDHTTPDWQIAATLIITGIGQGLFQSPNNSALMGAAPTARQGTAAGLLATARVMGQSMSVAVSGAIFIGLGGAAAAVMLRTLGHGVGAPAVADLEVLRATFSHAFHVAFLVCAGIAALGVVTSLVRGPEGGTGVKEAPGGADASTHLAAVW